MLVPYTPPCSKCLKLRWDPDALPLLEVKEEYEGSGRVSCPTYPRYIPLEVSMGETVQPCFEPRPEGVPHRAGQAPHHGKGSKERDPVDLEGPAVTHEIGDCLDKEFICDECYDFESRDMAKSLLSLRHRRPPAEILEWTAEAYVSFRNETHNSDNQLIDFDEWFEKHSLDEHERAHIWLECPDSCPVCRGDNNYLERARSHLKKMGL